MEKSKNLPEARLAFIGGSGTLAIKFPEDLKLRNVTVIERRIFRTPFGDSPEFTMFEIDGEPVLTMKMHGWRPGVKRRDASLQVFWVLEQAGVKTILAEGGVGSVRRDLRLGDFIVPDDYIDLSMRKDVQLSDRYLLIMRDPFCPVLSELLIDTSRSLFPARGVVRGVYAVTDGRHFESRAEVRMIESFGADVIGQTICPEAYLAREIGACYAGIYMAVNHAEGIGPDWSHKKLKHIFFNEGLNVGKIIIESLMQIMQLKKKSCQCAKLRKKTLLK